MTTAPMPDSLLQETSRRRTFAIISHPDAGKTTLTEKLLLYGGAIHLAGAIKAKKAARHATSDWMEIEKERGISITSSVLQFDYAGKRINLLDTPGHQDFSEDTYRTLSAADSAVMLIDNAKGVETQTKKLFEVCRLRDLPIFTFINKLDREGQDPFDLLSEVEKLLDIQCTPMMWPIGMGRDFKGVVHREARTVHLFQAALRGQSRIESQTIALADEAALAEKIGDSALHKLQEELALLDGASETFDETRFLNGRQTPVFFGSALTNFGIEPFLKAFTTLAPAPQAYASHGQKLAPEQSDFSAFVFKIQANMDPQHRDRIAFLRVCTGRFERGMAVWHERLGKELRLTKPLQFLAQERTLIDEAFAGDIIGLFDTGLLRIGDTVATNKRTHFAEVPHFSPEFFARVRIQDPLRRKQVKKGLDELSEEGAIQVFYPYGQGEMEPIIGAVGVLQFDVAEYRLVNEYGAKVSFERMPYDLARWIVTTDGSPFDPRPLRTRDRMLCVQDKDEKPMLLCKGQWPLNHAMNDFPKLKFLMIAP